ncbi:unnamed protein product [Rhizophagus irregularis]|nr:unnamed protein product [Rhizophagus irregularis]
MKTKNKDNNNIQPVRYNVYILEWRFVPQLFGCKPCKNILLTKYFRLWVFGWVKALKGLVIQFFRFHLHISLWIHVKLRKNKYFDLENFKNGTFRVLLILDIGYTTSFDWLRSWIRKTGGFKI